MSAEFINATNTSLTVQFFNEGDLFAGGNWGIPFDKIDLQAGASGSREFRPDRSYIKIALRVNGAPYGGNKFAVDKDDTIFFCCDQPYRVQQISDEALPAFRLKEPKQLGPNQQASDLLVAKIVAASLVIAGQTLNALKVPALPGVLSAMAATYLQIPTVPTLAEINNAVAAIVRDNAVRGYVDQIGAAHQRLREVIVTATPNSPHDRDTVMSTVTDLMGPNSVFRSASYSLASHPELTSHGGLPALVEAGEMWEQLYMFDLVNQRDHNALSEKDIEFAQKFLTDFAAMLRRMYTQTNMVAMKILGDCNTAPGKYWMQVRDGLDTLYNWGNQNAATIQAGHLEVFAEHLGGLRQ